MPVNFLYGRRESLIAKSEIYKKSVRSYLESMGFSQTFDSFSEGILEDMIFYNPRISPGQKYVIEAKAENLSMTSKALAKELIKYFNIWKGSSEHERFEFLLFMQGVKRPSSWESIFTINNHDAVHAWCDWYNKKCLGDAEKAISNVSELADFFSKSTVTVGSSLDLESAVLEKESVSLFEISRYANKLAELIDKRKSPIRSKSKLIMNIVPITLPNIYYECKSTAVNKPQIYDELEGVIIPPFIFRKNGSMLSFANFNESNPLTKYSEEKVKSMSTENLQTENPSFASQLVNIHLRRIIWNRGIHRDSKVGIYYYPMLSKSENVRYEISSTRNKRWVVKRYIHQENTPYAKKGETNFYRHRGIEIRTPTYWGTSYLELIPRKYYTLDGETPIEGEIRSKIDSRFRNPNWDRSKTRLGLMKFWKYLLVDSRKWEIPPEPWFDSFHFGDIISQIVDWSPKVIGEDQTRLWDFFGVI